MMGQEHPEGIHLAQEAAGKPARIVLAVMMPVDQGAQPSIPGPPCTTRGRGSGHMAQALQLRQRPGPTGCEVWLGPCRQATGGADEMGQAGLPPLDPVAGHAIAIADQGPPPAADQALEGYF